MNTKTHAKRTFGALFALCIAVLGMAFLASPASAHTPSAEASCSGVTATGTGYESGDTNTLGVRIDGGQWTTKTFPDTDSVTIPVPQDGQTHTWEAYVHTTNANPAYSHDYSGQVGPCGTPKPPAETREVPQSEESCKLGGVHTWTDVYTTEYVWDADTSSWVPGQETGPIRTDDQFTPYTNAQLKDCAEVKGEQTHVSNHHPTVHPTGHPATHHTVVVPAQAAPVPTQVESGLAGTTTDPVASPVGSGGISRGLAVAGFGLLTLLAGAVVRKQAR